ncbi:ABC transporter substrate-binding protein [Mesorhizobium sp. CAU 1732]|uniref:ABC transporter substrate-binding protein n=1 Tax=Mesorhizobium sp. CAU 1732 TaxID=3140358 RepID=UPI003261013D
MNAFSRMVGTTTLGIMLCASGLALAEDKIHLKMGLMTDMGGLTSAVSGSGSVLAAQMAIEDYKAVDPGIEVEFVSADHQLKADVGATIARRWLDQEQVDVIVDVPGSAIVLAIVDLVRERNKVILATHSSSSRITGTSCSPNTVAFTYSAWALANGTGSAVVRQGGDSWFFITADWEYGHSVQAETTGVIEAAGGQVLGSVLFPLETTDFSSYLLQAQASGAKVIGLIQSGPQTINTVKQANEFGIVRAGQSLATMYFTHMDAHALGLASAQGLQFTVAWDSNLDEPAREFSSRFAERNRGQVPSQEQAGVYSAVYQYLRAVSEAGSAEDGKRVLETMRGWDWFEDRLFGKTRLREDGTVDHNMYLAKVKSPDESQDAWDYFEILETIPAETAFQPLGQTGCPLVGQ